MAVGKAFTEMPNLPARPPAPQPYSRRREGAVTKPNPTPTLRRAEAHSATIAFDRP